MINRIRFLWIFLIGVWAPISHAGGDSWNFIITSFSSDQNDKFEVSLQPIERGKSFPSSCESLKISGDYSFFYWLLKFGDGPSKDKHKSALAVIEDKFKSKTPVQFGWMGDGVDVLSRQGNCVAISRGLEMVKERDNYTIYSYFKWP